MKSGWCSSRRRTPFSFAVAKKAFIDSASRCPPVSMMSASATSWVTRTVSAETLPGDAQTDSSFSSRLEPAVGKPSSWLCARMC